MSSTRVPAPRGRDPPINFPYNLRYHFVESRFMEARYNIYFAGQLRDGHDLASAQAAMARLFNADEATVARLFSGSQQLVKRNCDKSTALKYKQAIESAGGVPVIKAISVATPTPAAASAPMTAAQKIAALAAAPEPAIRRGAPSPEVPGAQGNDTAGTPAGQGGQIEDSASGIQLAPAGTPVLLPTERAAPAASRVQAPQLSVGASGERLSETSPPPPPPPDTSHLSEGPVGDILPTLPSSATPLSPDTSAIALSPDGTDLSDCAADPAAPPDLDLSGLDLAPAGADVLEPQFRNKHDTPAPATDHLALED